MPMQVFKIRKLGYAFIPNAAPSSLVSGALLRRNMRLAKKHGGLWVGGAIEMSSTGISFKPYALEETSHVGLKPVNILLGNIRSVRREFGWLTGIVIVNHSGGEFRFHCFRAKTVAAMFSKHLGER